MEKHQTEIQINETQSNFEIIGLFISLIFLLKSKKTWHVRSSVAEHSADSPASQTASKTFYLSKKNCENYEKLL